jgi:hypothetical protein
MFVHKRVRTKPRKTKAYVNNKDFYQAIIDYYVLKENARNSGSHPPQIPRYLGECIQLICQKLSGKPNFYSYSYKDEMVSDAVLNCFEALNNERFDTEYTNPFAYFTSVAYNAFLHRLKEEKDESLAKALTFERMFIMTDAFDGDLTKMLQSPNKEFSDDLMRNHYEKEAKKKALIKPKVKKKKTRKKTVFG